MSTSRAGAATAAFKTIELVPKEAELRVQLAAAYRLIEHFGWNESIYGHLTVRVPGPERHFLINPFGLRYGEVTASNLVKITLEGEIVGDTEWSVNAAGYAIHGAIHKGAPDAHCVMHTHSPAGMAVAALECGLLPISLDATLFHGTVGYHEYEGAIVSEGEKDRLVEDLGRNRALILRNHGLLTVGRTIPEAFLYLHRLETACKTQVDALAMNSALSLVPEEIARNPRGRSTPSPNTSTTSAPWSSRPTCACSTRRMRGIGNRGPAPRRDGLPWTTTPKRTYIEQ